MGKMPTNSLGKSSELKLHCFCLFYAYSMPKDICSARCKFSFSKKIVLKKSLSFNKGCTTNEKSYMFMTVSQMPQIHTYLVKGDTS